MSDNEQALDALVEAIATSAKYKNVSADLVRATGAQELAKGVSTKAAVKATKNKLHQVGGAYQPRRIDYGKALMMLQSAASADEWQEACCRIMQFHASTRERLPILDSFYRTVLSEIPAPLRVLDVACGLGPLAYSWMSLPDQASYVAYDIYADMVQFLQEYMELGGINGRAEVRDVIHNPPRGEVDLALLLKTLPCLEQLEKGAAGRMLDAIQARYLLISILVSTLGGRQKGMVATYDAQFDALMAGRDWATQRFLFDTELAFLVDTQGELASHE